MDKELERTMEDVAQTVDAVQPEITLENMDAARMEGEQLSTKQESWEFIRVIALAVLMALVFRSVLFEPFHIPSGSMKNTLLIGDYLFVSKYSYGYSRYSFPLGLPLFEGRIFASKPERGDVVVFRLPSNTRIDYIKRVIGLPGDRIQMRGGVLHINGQPMEMHQVEPFHDVSYYTDVQGEVQPSVNIIPRYIETLPNGVLHSVLDETPIGEVDDTKVYVVPEGHYFMMGDNRDNSTDSRYDDVSYVPFENIIGKAQRIFFSTDGSARLWQVWRWLSSLRTERFLQSIR